MNLLMIDDKTGRIVPHPELLTYKCFRELWDKVYKIDGDRDGTKKRRNLAELGYVFFSCVPTSRFRSIRNLDEREVVIRQELDLPTDWKPDDLLKECIRQYSKEVSFIEEKAVLQAEGLAEDLAMYVESKGDALRSGKMVPKDAKDLIEVSNKIKEVVQNAKEARNLLVEVMDRARKGRKNRTINKFEMP